MSVFDPEQEAALAKPMKKGITRYLWVVGFCVCGVVIWFMDFDKLREALASLNLKLLVCVMAVELAGQWLRALKWRIALGPKNRAIGLFFLSRCAGYWVPMRMGEFSPLLIKEHRTPKMGAWILVDRLLEIGTTLLLGVVGVVALRIQVGGTIIAVVVAGLLFVVGPFYVLTRRGLFLWLAGHTREGTVLHRGAMFLAAVRHEIFALGGRIPVTSAMTFLAGAIDIFGGMLLYASFGYPLSFPLIAAAKCTHALTSAVPFLPNATGAPFVAAGYFLIEVGGVPLEVYTSATFIYLALINMVFWTSAGFGLMGLRKPSP